jgi:hypothetical protein
MGSIIEARRAGKYPARATGQGAAAAEFRKILAHKGRNQGPQYSLAYLGLSRALALTRETASARQAYQEFLTMWRDADPDVPMLVANTRRYRRRSSSRAERAHFPHRQSILLSG